MAPRVGVICSANSCSRQDRPFKWLSGHGAIEG